MKSFPLLFKGKKKRNACNMAGDENPKKKTRAKMLMKTVLMSGCALFTKVCLSFA